MIYLITYFSVAAIYCIIEQLSYVCLTIVHGHRRVVLSPARGDSHSHSPQNTWNASRDCQSAILKALIRHGLEGIGHYLVKLFVYFCGICEAGT